MADDDRLDWLDENAAERLLRGEEVMPSAAWKSPADRAEAERLAAFLSVVARAGEKGAPAGTPYGRTGGDGSLRGEEAALAAFRAARDSRPSHTGLFRRRSGSRGPFGGRGPIRPVRAAAAVALLACTAGGVAMAATGGVIPTPFSDQSPSVASSTTTPGADTDGSRDGFPSSSPGADGLSGSPAPGTDGHGRHQDAGPGGKHHTGRDGPSHAGTQPGDDGDEDQHGGTAGLGPLCRDYLAAREGNGKQPSERDMDRLSHAAGGPDKILAYCQHRHASGSGGRGGGPTSAGPSVSPSSTTPESTTDGDDDQQGDGQTSMSGGPSPSATSPSPSSSASP